MLHISCIIVEIAVYVAARTFNEGTHPLSLVMNTLEINFGSNTHRHTEKIYSDRVKLADERANGNTQKGRKLRSTANRYPGSFHNGRRTVI